MSAAAEPTPGSHVPAKQRTALTFKSPLALAPRILTQRIVGRISTIRGLTMTVEDLPLPVGSLVRIIRAGESASTRSSRQDLLGEIVAFDRSASTVMVLGQTEGIRPGDSVEGVEIGQSARVGAMLLGRVLDGLGRPIDGKGDIRATDRRAMSPAPIPALKRDRIQMQMLTGVRSLDLLNPVGKGQRLGLFAGPGVGKSTLLGTIAKRASADVNIIALIGERGREVMEFIENNLGEEGLARSIVVVATGDEPALLRIRAAKLSCALAEYFRDLGQDVLLMMDSVTRFAHAQRQVGLAAGEPPTAKGYTPSVFAELGLLLERAGIVKVEGDQRPAIAGAMPGPTTAFTTAPTTGSITGSITGLYTILVDGDDMTEPIADAARGILDGHIVLSRKLAQKGHFPAVDCLDSVSRVADDVTEPRCRDARRQIIRMLAAYRDVEDLVQIGAFARGANPEADVAIDVHRSILGLLQQGRGDFIPHAQALSTMFRISDESRTLIDRANKTREGGKMR